MPSGPSVASAAAAVVEDLWFAYRPNDWVLRGVDLSVPHGAFMAILGSSGTGKTTLLKILAGLLRPSRGRVSVLGHSLTGWMPRTLRGQIGYIPQQLGLVRSMTALENVLLGSLSRRRGLLTFLGLFPKEETERAQACLAFLGLEGKAGARVQNLSGGQRQRVAIARTLLQRPKIVFADEFVSDLDLPLAAELLETVHGIARREGITFVMTMHELPLVQRFSDEAAVLNKGKIVHRGAAQDLTLSLLAEMLDET